jgi:hypothetical protein
MLNPIASDHKGDLTKHSSIEIQYRYVNESSAVRPWRSDYSSATIDPTRSLMPGSRDTRTDA